MQTQMSAEEFSRFQSQLLLLRQEKYAAEDARNRALKESQQLEVFVATQSGELAELRSKLSRIQRAGDIDTCFTENETLRHRLVNIESSFQLQIATLRLECERVQSENLVLLATLKTAGINKDSVPNSVVDYAIQTDNCVCETATRAMASQTYQPGWACVLSQTAVTLDMLSEQEMRLSKLLEFEGLYQKEKKTREDLTQQLNKRNVDNERLEGEAETLRNELAVVTKRNDRIQKELKRQLTVALRAVEKNKISVEVGSMSSLVLVPPHPPQSDTQSIGSYSLCGTNGGQMDGELSGDESLPYQPAQSATHFTEDDLKSLLNRLADVQEENCSLRRQVKRLSSELEAKSTIIQQRLTDKIASVAPTTPSASNHHLPHAQNLFSPSSGSTLLLKTSVNGNRQQSVTDLFSSIRTRLRSLDAAVVPRSVTGFATLSAPHQNPELMALKRLCEELMTRNISLERALELSLAKGEHQQPDDF